MMTAEILLILPRDFRMLAFKALTIHGRTRAQLYKGTCRLDANRRSEK